MGHVGDVIMPQLREFLSIRNLFGKLKCDSKLVGTEFQSINFSLNELMGLPVTNDEISKLDDIITVIDEQMGQLETEYK